MTRPSRSRPRATTTSSGYGSAAREARVQHWLRILIELENRGVEDVLMLVCDGLKGPARRGQ